MEEVQNANKPISFRPGGVIHKHGGAMIEIEEGIVGNETVGMASRFKMVIALRDLS